MCPFHSHHHCYHIHCLQNNLCCDNLGFFLQPIPWMSFHNFCLIKSCGMYLKKKILKGRWGYPFCHRLLIPKLKGRRFKRDYGEDSNSKCIFQSMYQFICLLYLKQWDGPFPHPIKDSKRRSQCHQQYFLTAYFVVILFIISNWWNFVTLILASQWNYLPIFFLLCLVCACAIPLPLLLVICATNLI